MRALLLIAACAVLGACATGGADPRDDYRPLRETTLQRYDGSGITMEELEATRNAAIDAAETLRRLERDLREPWAETRSAAVILRQLTLAEPARTRAAANLWDSAEPTGDSRRAHDFMEGGTYSNQFSPSGFAQRSRFAPIENFVEAMLRQHEDSTTRGAMLAAWRRFSPAVTTRGDAYIASSWLLELESMRPVTVCMNESLLGPHVRSHVADDGGLTFLGPTQSYEGYATSAVLVDLFRAGPESPVAAFVASLLTLAEGRGRLSTDIAPGNATPDRDFMLAVARGLQGGFAEVEALPASTTRLTVTFSYLVDRAEARATLSFRRDRGRWTLDLFDYEPAAASLIRGNARLDLLPALRALHRDPR